jgi:hypothetical protein
MEGGLQRADGENRSENEGVSFAALIGLGNL